jgi:ADP-ribose diphosphatase
MTFRKLGERVLFDGQIVSLARVELVGPDGVSYEREVVHHPGAVAVVAVEGDTTWLVRQFRSAVGAELLEVPAGKRDVAGERAEVTARRELEEEVGLVASTIERLASFYSSPGFCDEMVEVFLATDLERSSAAPQGVEERHMQVVNVALDDVDGLVGRGEIADAKTIIALTLASREVVRRRSGLP